MRLETCSSWRVIIFVVILKNCLHLWVYIVVIGMQDAKFFYLTSALDGGWVVKATPRHLYCRETDLIPTVQVDGPHGLSVHVRKASPPLGMDSRTVNSVASRMLKWIQFNAFHTIWQEAALSGMCGAAPKCVVLPQNSSGSLERNHKASYVRGVQASFWTWESGAICRRQRHLMTVHVLEHIRLRTYCLSEVTRTSTSGLFLQKLLWNEEGADELIKRKLAEWSRVYVWHKKTLGRG